MRITYAHVKNDEHLGRYKSNNPIRAARKVANKLFKQQDYNSTLKFKIVHKSRGKNHNKCYVYTAKKRILDRPERVKLKDSNTGLMKIITFKHLIDCKRVLVKDLHKQNDYIEC